MTNGEKFKEVFKISQVDEGLLYAFAWLPNHDAVEISIDWWNAEYNEPKSEKLCTTCRHHNTNDDHCEKCAKHGLVDEMWEDGNDLISRKSAIEAIQRYGVGCLDYMEFSPEQCEKFVIGKLNELPSVTSQELTTKNETLVSLGAYKQVAWERDIAIEQLHELGYEFGQKIEPTPKNDVPNINDGNIYKCSCGYGWDKIEVRKPCINYEDGCEEWSGCPCVHFKCRK